MSVRKPLIGITGRRWPASRIADFIPKALHDAEFDLHFSEYPAAIAKAGGLPVELARDGSVAETLARLDGVVISGGADVDPSFYGAERSVELGHTELERDAWELAVIAEAIRIDLPLLGICRGAQLIQVHFGGALIQHVGLEDGEGHPRFDDPRDMGCHAVQFHEGTLAHALYGPEIQVNSLHHQTLAEPAPGIVVSGIAPDGVIEAIEVPDTRLFGVQWHPEMLDNDDPSLTWLISEATDYLHRSLRPSREPHA